MLQDQMPGVPSQLPVQITQESYLSNSNGGHISLVDQRRAFVVLLPDTGLELSKRPHLSSP